MSTTNVTFRISQRGAISVYGLGQRFPTTLYADSWIALAKAMPQILKYIDENKDAMAQQAEEFAQAEAVADKRGLQGKERDEFFTKIFGVTKAVKADSPKSQAVDALDAKLRARGI